MAVTTDRSRRVRVPGSRSARAEETAQHLSRADRVAQAKDARAVAPLESHAEFTPGGSSDVRADAVYDQIRAVL